MPRSSSPSAEHRRPGEVGPSGYGAPDARRRASASSPRVNAFNWAGGANRLLAALSALGWASVEPLPQSQRNGLAIWDIAAGRGHRVGVYDWMNTWPVEQIPGYEYTSVGSPPGKAYPPEEVMAVLAGAEQQRPALSDPILAKYSRHYGEAFALWRHFAPSVSFHYNKVMDDMHDHWTGASYFVRPIPPGTLHFPEVVEDAYRLTDWWIGRFLDALPPDRVLALVSDHGYEFNGTAHIFAPPGVIVLSGGPFACGRLLRGAGVLDVVPTLLVALGIPPAEAMPGRVLEMAFGDGAPPAPTRVASYPDTWRHPEASPALSHDWEDLRRSLQALGYAN